MRLLLYTDSVDLGGAETSAARLLFALPKTIDVTVLGIDPRVVDWIAGHRTTAASVVLPAPRRRFDPRTLSAHVRALRKLSPDVIQLNLITPWSCRYAVLAAALLRRRGVVAVAHSPQRTTNRLYRVYMRAYAKRVAAVVSVGRRVADEMEALLGLPAGAVRVIYNGVPDVPLEQRPRADNDAVIGSMGRLDGHKGFDVLLRALPEIPNARVLLVGDGPERDSLFRLARDLDVQGRLAITGWQKRPRDFLTSMDVYALPSRLEGLPLGVCEAMLAELPVVAADVGSIREAVIDGETGLVVPPDSPAELAEALRGLLEDATLRKRLGGRGRARALELFSVDEMARRYESLYEEVTA